MGCGGEQERDRIYQQMVKGMLEGLDDKTKPDLAAAIEEAVERSRQPGEWKTMTMAEYVRKIERDRCFPVSPSSFGNHPWYWRLRFFLGSLWNLAKDAMGLTRG